MPKLSAPCELATHWVALVGASAEAEARACRRVRGHGLDERREPIRERTAMPSDPSVRGFRPAGWPRRNTPNDIPPRVAPPHPRPARVGPLRRPGPHGGACEQPGWRQKTPPYRGCRARATAVAWPGRKNSRRPSGVRSRSGSHHRAPPRRAHPRPRRSPWLGEDLPGDVVELVVDSGLEFPAVRCFDRHHPSLTNSAR
jgi:hypothetical protein